MRKHQIVGCLGIAIGVTIVCLIGALGFFLTLNLLPQFKGFLG